MIYSRLGGILRTGVVFKNRINTNSIVTYKAKKRSGAIPPEPPRTPFGIIGVICTVVPGLLIGATISKYIANFLEENDLFVPSDDDDDDD